MSALGGERDPLQPMPSMLRLEKGKSTECDSGN